MGDERQADAPGGEELQHLKRVSRIKHLILQKYLPPWASILGSRHQKLAYFDCFAGPGEYELEGKSVAGSPVIAVKGAIEFLKSRGDQSLLMYLIDDKPKQVERLEASLKHLQPYPKNLEVNVRCSDSRLYVPKLLGSLGTLAPSFFLIDPYGHPLPLPVINGILRRGRTEALINLMWFRISMDLSNPLVQSRLDELFGDDEWRKQPFMGMHGIDPVRGCTKISPGCKHCYAETFAERFRGVKGHPYEQGFDLRLVPEKLGEPLRWRTPKMIFVNSMSDLFHDAVPEDYIEAVGRVMVAAKWHTYYILTKRSERLRKLLNSRLSFAARQPHIWWGVSVEDRKYGLPRIEDLRNADAEARFLSIEPLLEDVGKLKLDGISWVIVGGESGAGARPMKKEWVVSVRDQCRRAGVPFFFKQWGGVRKGTAGRKLDGRTYDEFPRRVRHPVLAPDECLSLAADIGVAFKTADFVECIV